MTKNVKLNLWDLLAAAAGGLFLQFVNGICYLTHNQCSYFIYGMRLSEPHFIPKDWFTWQTFHHDFAFGYLFYLLYHLGPLPTVVVAADILLLIAMAYSILILCRRYCVYPWFVYGLLMVWLGIISPNEIGLGGQYLFHGFLQPSEVAGCLMVVGITLLLSYHFLSAGVVLGLAGLFHGAYLASFGPAIIATALAVGVWRNSRSMLAFGLPLALCWSTFVLVVGQAFAHSSPASQDISNIMVHLRAPGDFILSNWPLSWTVNWFLWAFLGLLAVLNVPKEHKYNELRICFFVLFMTSLLGIAQLAFIKNNSVTLLMLWRSSPMVLVLGQLLVLDSWLRFLFEPKSINNKDKLFIGVSLLALGWLLANQWGLSLGDHKSETNRRFLWLMFFIVAWGINAGVSRFEKLKTRRIQIITVALFIMMGAIALKSSLVGLKYSCNYERHPETVSLGDMEQWIKANTPADSIFVSPPDMEYMPLRARRAIVVAWSLACYLPSNLDQWYQRLSDECGLTPKPLIANSMTLMDGYNRMDAARAKRLRDLYGASYVIVLAKKNKGNLEGLIERYANEDYRVLEIPQ